MSRSNSLYRFYIVQVPPTMMLGSYKIYASSTPFETMRKNALREYNRSREREGLRPIKRMPAGTKYIKD